MNLKHLIVGLTAIVAGYAINQSEAKAQDIPGTAGYESITERMGRLRKLEPFGSSAVSVREYVMSEGTELGLRSIAGIRAGTMTVITDGEGHYLAQGRTPPTYSDAMGEALFKETDVNEDKIVTWTEEEQLSLKVFQQYAQNVGKEEYKRRVCAANRDDGVDKCGFDQKRESSHCEFDYFKGKSDVEFNEKRARNDCEFNAFRNDSDPKPCLDGVTEEYAKRAQEVKATNTGCLEQAKASFATCTLQVELEYQQCLKSDTLPQPKKSETRYIDVDKDGTGIIRDGDEIEKRTFDELK
ncbi:hypothetical protein HZC30_04315 [Candidatus Woesearchaeota archaeon]|nr:hypothetical protein [Candidatus Woesearchaeota archaeon]